MFDLDLERVIGEIKLRKAERVLLQLPDGLKMKAKEVADAITKETQAETLIWLGSCFGSCDVPLGLEPLKVDLMIQWGHNRFHKEKW